MTRQDGHKKTVRERMAATGEPYHAARAAVLAEAFDRRTAGIPAEECGVRALPESASPAEQARAEAIWRATDNPRQQCLCSGTACRHGQPCEMTEDCDGRVVHADRFPASMFTPTVWFDVYVCVGCGEEFGVDVTLAHLPWGEYATADRPTALTVYSGVRHPNFADDEDEDSWHGGGCGECGAIYDYQCNCGWECGECGATDDYQCNCA